MTKIQMMIRNACNSISLKSIGASNFLSFGESEFRFDLGPLNVMIGANGSGKSNFIELVAVLRAVASDIDAPIRQGGGFSEWKSRGGSDPQISISAVYSDHTDFHSHHFAFAEGPGHCAHIQSESFAAGSFGQLGFEPFSESVRKLIAGPDGGSFPENTRTGLASFFDSESPFHRWVHFLSSIRIYRDWNLGQGNLIRQGLPLTGTSTFLEDDFSNLAAFLADRSKSTEFKSRFLPMIQNLFPELTDYGLANDGAHAQLFLVEGNHRIPAIRLSDGTLRFFCLAALLCDPTPPPLICLEAPELGLHPDLIPTLGDLLIETAERTQLIVSTYSDVLIDCFHERPETIVVCGKLDGTTTLKRLDAEELKPRLEKHSLGRLWMDGSIGGNRW